MSYLTTSSSAEATEVYRSHTVSRRQRNRQDRASFFLVLDIISCLYPGKHQLLTFLKPEEFQVYNLNQCLLPHNQLVLI